MFEKGQSGNPNGRPPGSGIRGVSLVAALRTQLETATALDGTPILDAIAKRLVDLAMYSREHRTALEAIRTIMERTDGKVAERVDIELRVRELAERYGMDASEVLREADDILHAVNSR